MAALALGPISVSVDADADAFYYYTTGVLNCCCGTDLDHAVTAVGYNREANPPYYIVRNSWGPDWGESGYIRLGITAGEGICGVQMEPVYPNLLIK